ncbi:MAG: hypothetical protein OES24_07895, partial [Acidimicrobiia bacterium]|nr:hypothetical protein [Acidimicrobiia bacterium]
MDLVEAFDDDLVSVVASSQSVQRGRRYARDGRVSIVDLTDRTVTASVRGTVPYRVELSIVGEQARWRCGCPVGARGEFCKHCVAVAGVLGTETETDGDPIAEVRVDEDDPVARFVGSLSTGQLVDLVLEQADLDERFRTKLSRMAHLQQTPDRSQADASVESLDLTAMKKQVTAAFGRGFVSYREAPAWAAQVNEAIEWISNVCDAGHFRTAALLAEHAHARAETAAERVDDSDGWITDIFHRIAAIHATACAEGAFPPEDLARRLIKLELNAELDTFHRSAISHAEALGPEGLALYGKLAQEAFDALPAHADRHGRAFRVRQARVAHAIATGDPDRLAEVLADDIGSPYDHVEIIDAYAATGRTEEALAWADRSLSEFADRHHQLVPVRERRADLLRSLGRKQEVADMYRASFEATPTAETYRLWIDNAPDASSARHDAIALVIDRLPRAAPSAVAAEAPSADSRSAIGRVATNRAPIQAVEVLLAADDEEQAWSVALTHGATSDQWRQLGQRRQLTDSESAITILAMDAEAAINRKNRSGYRTAAATLDRIKRLADHAGRPELHTEILDDIKTRQQRKTSLME